MHLLARLGGAGGAYCTGFTGLWGLAAAMAFEVPERSGAESSGVGLLFNWRRVAWQWSLTSLSIFNPNDDIDRVHFLSLFRHRLFNSHALKTKHSIMLITAVLKGRERMGASRNDHRRAHTRTLKMERGVTKGALSAASARKYGALNM
ncbi:unnamed protein product [Ceratitis capitata]|uniref:(Mediterranean fruit fly) hypothetical protein n=1 Tax=Ceratitis capitata TaxID=7213 RepID=A0A811UJY6_CERCA|nr:unnamed protein product [Ceratitis capitata]